jgi:hypothetical protein
MTGNQHSSRRGDLLFALRLARVALKHGQLLAARAFLQVYRCKYATAPASTRRRWKCGR